ncbi:fasciclin domain-containing protein [Gramella sp. AN32]|uniref:Fasciclin domain-containing protein n=1 Tax=Christiangramia antarctica TaxID=2058158 RepID=A0ABW5XAE6_9FLAO|nr:fasciclin domain-containing protein [Gramella sp. AN32]MCM4155908.1 fasciclin [Gramella sp. AN32]
MKFKILLMSFAASAMIFTSCDDGKKEKAEKEKMEMEAQREAEMEAENAKMEMESNSIAAKAMETDTLSTLVSALQTAEMAALLKTDDGPYTVFAPNNGAFAKVKKATLDTLMLQKNKSKLGDVLKYHVVEDEISSQELVEMINDNDGKYTISTMGGGELVASLKGDKVILTDENGNTATVIQPDVDASNGVVHIIDAVVMRKPVQ